jgi:hypothetical protein
VVQEINAKDRQLVIFEKRKREEKEELRFVVTRPTSSFISRLEERKIISISRRATPC